MRSEIKLEPARRPVDDGRELELTTLWGRISRKKRWLFGPALACFLASLVFVSVTPPRYTGEAKVLVENGENYFSRSDKADQPAAQLPDDEAVQSQVQLIQSRDIARQAITRLDLKGRPEFDPLAGSLNPVARFLVLVGLERDPTGVPAEDRILTSYYDKLTVFPVTKSRVITIEFASTDPELAARAANTIADLYIEAQSAAKRDAARAAAASLASLVADIRTRAADAEAKADAFRTQSGLLMGTNNNTITSQQLADINTQLAQARTAEADAQAKAKLLRDMIRQGRIAEVPDVANNELIRRMSEQRVNLRAEMALQSRTLLPGHPHMQELSAQLSDVDNQLRVAAEKAVRTLENDARISASRVENLAAALDVQKKTASTAGVDQVRLNTLELQSRLLKDQLEFNTTKYQEAIARESATSTPADARVISRAVAPHEPSFPKKLPIIAICTLAGLVLSLGMLIARELLSGRAFEPSEAAPYLPRQVVATRATDEWRQQVIAAPPPSIEGLPLLDRDGIVAALETLRIQGTGARAVKVLLTAPGASSQIARVPTAHAAMALARLLAARSRTILVDCNRDDPAVLVHSLVAVAPEAGNTAGLSELLAGSASFAEVIHRDGLSRLHVVPVGRTAFPEDPRAGINLVLNALAETYDFVVLHGPSGAEGITLILSNGADAVVAALPDGMSETGIKTARAEFEAQPHLGVYAIAASQLTSHPPVRDAA